MPLKINALFSEACFFSREEVRPQSVDFHLLFSAGFLRLAQFLLHLLKRHLVELHIVLIELDLLGKLRLYNGLVRLCLSSLS